MPVTQHSRAYAAGFASREEELDHQRFLGEYIAWRHAAGLEPTWEQVTRLIRMEAGIREAGVMLVFPRA
jgi:hypothetical protein